MPSHRLAEVLGEAVEGRFPPVDGRIEVVPPTSDATGAVVAFTGHAFVLTDRSPGDAVFRGIDGFGGATDPRFLVSLAGPSRAIGSLDIVAVRRAGSTTSPLPELFDHDDHPRVVRARRHRRDVRVFGDERGIVVIGRGLVGRTEISIELTGAEHGRATGRGLIDAGLASVGAGEPVYAQVAPGNAASVRMFLSCGFVPIAGEVLFEPSHSGSDPE